MSRFLGLDLGGTNIKVAVVDQDEGDVPRVVARDQRPCRAAEGPDAVIAELIAAGNDAISRWGPVPRIGVGVPGLFDEVGAIVLFPNLPGPWNGTPVAAPIAAATGVPVAMINDARAFTLAESRVGAARGHRNVAALVLGTGIGGGIVVDGHLHYGRLGRAGELAHMVIAPGGPLCGCGNRGCLEAVATSGVLANLAGQPTAHDVFTAAANGDEQSRLAIAEVADHLGVAIANVITVLVPERIVLGGGVAEAGDALLDPIRAAVARHCVLVPPDWYEIVAAELGPHAGAIGAALWAGEPAAHRPDQAA